MKYSITERLQRIERSVNHQSLKEPDTNKSGKSTVCVVEQEKKRDLLTISYKLQQDIKLLSEKEYETCSLLYGMKEKTNKRYNKHLRLLKPMLNKYPKFWKELAESEQNAKGFTGWMNQIKKFYSTLLKEENKAKIQLENHLQVNEIKEAFNLIIGLRQVYRKKQKCSWECKIKVQKLNHIISELEALSSENYLPIGAEVAYSINLSTQI